MFFDFDQGGEELVLLNYKSYLYTYEFSCNLMLDQFNLQYRI